MEATLFSAWIYDTLKPYAAQLVMGHPAKMKTITAGKKKSDSIDARTIADLLRCDLLPTCYVLAPEMRDLRRLMRYRNLVVQQSVRMQNKMAGLLMESGTAFHKQKLHGKNYFTQLVENLQEVPESVKDLLRMSRSSMEMFESTQKQIQKRLLAEPALQQRVARLQSIRGVGPITALTWALKVADPQRFSSIGDAVSYCGLTAAFRSSAGKQQRGLISKQRNAHLQTVLIEAAKLAPRWNFGSNMNSGGKLNAFVRELQNGIEQEKAFRDVFGDPHDFYLGFAEYVAHAAWPVGVLPPYKGVDSKTFSERKLTAPETDYELGSFHLRAQDYATGRTLIQRSVELDPKLASAHEELGFIEFAAGHDDQARTEWQRAIALDANLYRSLFAVTMSGTSLAEQTPAQLLETQAQLQRVTSLAAYYAPAYIELALVEWRLGNMQQAFKDAKHAEEMEPSRAGYHLVTGRILLNGNQPALAAKYARYVADHWTGSDHNEAVDLWQAIPPDQRGEGAPLVSEVPTGASTIDGQISSLTCSETPGPRHLIVTITSKDTNSTKPLSFSSDGHSAIGFSDSFWWGADHFSSCHHLAGHRAVLAYKTNAAGEAEIVELEVRDDLPPPRPKLSPATANGGSGESPSVSSSTTLPAASPRP